MGGIEPQQAEHTSLVPLYLTCGLWYIHVLSGALVGLEQNDILPLANTHISMHDVP